ncbi:MAG TPA: MFS transporter [Bacillota bacterium]|nr:MFS transporter [Bacillota bacterium]
MPRYIWLLAIATTISVTGGSFLWPLNTIYMHNELGNTLAFAGFILMLNQAATIVGNLIGGVLFDKFSPYKTILAGTAVAMCAASGLMFMHTNITAYAIFLIIIGLGTGTVWPVMFAMAGSVWPTGGRRAFNAVYVAQNLGVAIGAALGGYIASFSYAYIFIANASIIFLFFLFVLIMLKGMDQERDRQMHTTILEQTTDLGNKSAFIALIILSSGFLITWFAYSQWQTTIASHTQDVGIPLEQYSLLWALNGFLIVLGQPLVRQFTKRIPTLKTQIYIGNSILISSFIIAMFAEEFAFFITAMAILTVGEMLVWPAIPALAHELAPSGKAGFYQGFVNSVAAAGRMMGPIIGGLIVDQLNIRLLFYIIIGLMFVPFITTRIFDMHLKKPASNDSTE